MKFVALVSGGKDSIYSIMECIKNGHELVACAHLAPALGKEVEEESYMYQTAGSECIQVLVEECLGVPLYMATTNGRSENTSLVYSPNGRSDSRDEVEDMYTLLQGVKEEHPEITAVSSGAILSTYQRTRVESVCSRLNLTSLSFLWRVSHQVDLLERMLQDGLEAVLVKVASPPGLLPGRHLGKSLGQLQPHLLNLYQKYGFHVCGEGGEYETLVLDSPIHKRKLVLQNTQILYDEENDGIGTLHISSCTSEPKQETQISPMSPTTETTTPITQVNTTTTSFKEEDLLFEASMPHVKKLKGGIYHTSEMKATMKLGSNYNIKQLSDVDLAVQEAYAIFQSLKHLLSTNLNCTVHNVVMVHLYLKDISHFATINSHYQQLFGTYLPPSRSCVGISGSTSRVKMDCLIHCNSNDNSRSTLHVQSRSYWAPTCVGPYAQAQILNNSSLIYLAGQIGLNPACMTFSTPTSLVQQLQQCWTNVANVLDALEGNPTVTENSLSTLIYLSSDHDFEWKEIANICLDNLSNNANIIPGAIDNDTPTATTADFDGYEDEETRLELMQSPQQQQQSSPENRPEHFCLAISIPQMPLGALAEIECICTTPRLTECLETKTMFHSKTITLGTRMVDNDGGCWDLGFDDNTNQNSYTSTTIELNSVIKSIGMACIASACIVATPPPQQQSQNHWNDIDMMISLLHEMWTMGVDQVKSVAQFESILQQTLHIRLYYNQTSGQKNEDMIRLALQSVLSSHACTNYSQIPTHTLIPVQDIQLISTTASTNLYSSSIFAIDLLVLDPIHSGTEVWIHHGRTYDS